jgi:hypothetical protein
MGIIMLAAVLGFNFVITPLNPEPEDLGSLK